MKAAIVFAFFLVSNFKSYSKDTLAINNPKYITTLGVLEKVAKTFGDNRMMPILRMPSLKKSGDKALFYAKPEPLIIFDEKLYDICQTFGKDSLAALAVLMGHELTHYYENHAEWSGFLKEIKKNELSENPNVQKENERNADLRGVFQAFVAGYNAFSIVKPLYEKIYKDYGIKELPGYYLRDERIQFAISQIAYARKIGTALELGNFLYLNNHYEEAERSFNYVNNIFPLSEVLLNQANCLLKQAYELSLLSQMPFRLPIGLSTSNKLLSDLRGTDDGKKQIYLQKSLSIFNRIIKQSPEYESAYIGLSMALLLQNKVGSANDVLSDWVSNTKHQDPNGNLIRAIVFAKNQNTRKLNTILNSVSGVYEEGFNRKLLQNYANWLNKNDEIVIDSLKTITIEQIVKTTLPKTNKFETFSLPFITDPNTKINVTNEMLLNCHSDIKENMLLYNIEITKKKYSVLRPMTNCSWQTKENIKKGDSVAILISKLGDTKNRIVYQPQDYWLGYPGLGYWFIIKNEIVEDIIVFCTK